MGKWCSLSIRFAIYPLAIAAAFFFYSMNSGITITNDGSHFALFDALVSSGSPELPTARQFAFGDSASYEGRTYSDRNPGLAFIAVGYYGLNTPVNALYRSIGLDPGFARQYDADQYRRIPIVMLIPALCGGLLWFLGWQLCRVLGVSGVAAILASGSLVFGTIALRYSTVFYSHILAACLLSASLILFFQFRQNARPFVLVFACFLLSLAVLVEHLLLLAAGPVAVYLLLAARRQMANTTALSLSVVALGVPMAMLAAYNWVCFDSPFSIAHFHHASDAQNHRLATLLRWDHTLHAAHNLLFGAPKSEVGRQDLVGLVSHSPFVVFSIAAILPWVNRGYPNRAENLTLVCIIVLLVLGGSSVFAPYGGWDRDYRYFLAAIPLLAPSIGLVIQYLLRPEGKFLTSLKLVLLGAFILLLAVACSRQLGHIRHPGQVQYDTLIVNGAASLQNVSIALLYLAALALVFYLLWRFVGRLRDNSLARPE